ncbi:hypothetical protein Vretifemale_7366, partial [Volvox reticuliferus]
GATTSDSAALGSLPTSPFASHPSLLRTTSMQIDDARLSGQGGGSAACGVDGIVGLRSLRPVVANASHNLPGPVRGSKLISSVLTAALPPGQQPAPDILSAGTTAVSTATAFAQSPARAEPPVLSDACLTAPMKQRQQPAAIATLGSGRCYGNRGNTTTIAATATYMLASSVTAMAADATE